MLIYGFNAACNDIDASFLKVGDESMSEICFRKTAKGNLLHLFYAYQNSEPLEAEFKTVACYIKRALLFIEVQRGKECMKQIKYQKELGSTAACTKRMMEATKSMGQKYIKGGINDCFIFDSWFAYKKSAEASMEVGAELIGMVNKNTKGFCKETIENRTKDWPGGSYLVLRIKPMVPGDMPLIAIVYKYNARKVLSFIFIYNEGITNNVIPCLSKYPEKFTNVAICPVARPLVV